MDVWMDPKARWPERLARLGWQLQYAAGYFALAALAGVVAGLVIGLVAALAADPRFLVATVAAGLGVAL